MRVQWVAEARLPVSVAQVGAELEHVGVHPARAGWYFQQLLKLQARHGPCSLPSPRLCSTGTKVDNRTLPARGNRPAGV